MFFKKKCPKCGTKNPKESMTCANCGALFVEGGLPGKFLLQLIVGVD